MIKLKTIHQLQEATATDTQDLFEVSRPAGTDKYSSRSIKYSTIEQSMKNSLSSTMVDAFHMKYTDGTNISLSTLHYRVGQIWVDATWNAANEVTMNKLLKLTPSKNTAIAANISLNQFTTRQNVEALIDNSQTFIGTNSIATANPVNPNGVGTNDDLNLMKWKFDDGGNDSSLAKDEYGNKYGYIRCRKTGHLTIYGWLADNGNVSPQEAWVGLFGQV